MVSGTTTIDELLAGCDAAALAALDLDALVELVASLLTVWPRLDAARLRAIAAMDSRAGYRLDGARDMATWLADHAGERRGAARRDVDLAAAVSAMPAVAAEPADGGLSKAKAAQLARAADASADEQAALVETAKTTSVEQLARAVDRWEIEHQPEPVPVEESLTITPTPGGGRVEAQLDTEGLEWVQVAVDAAAEQLGLRERPWGQRRAQGLVAACRYFLDHADIPSTRVGRPTVVVTVDIETLAATTGGSARSDSGAYLRGEVARRLACDAGLVRVITDPASMPLDVGRRTRVPSPAQRRAVIERDRHCTAPGCSTPPWACEIHHLDHWGRDHGRTDLDRLTLLCWHHHTLHHHDTRHRRPQPHPDAA
jgi:Domain of unknown function (DUF222)